jgi:hypothetical protein
MVAEILDIEEAFDTTWLAVKLSELHFRSV